MALPTFKTQPLIAPQQPRLLAAPMQYDAQYQEQYSNALRLYFNQIQNFLQLFTTNTGGSLLRFPNGAFFQDGVTTLTNSITNTSTADIVVASTAQFGLTAGAILIGNEIISYTGKTATSFTGITRGAFGSTKAAHTAGASVTEAQNVPSAATATAVAILQTTTSNGVAIDPTDLTKIVFAVSGIYNIQFSVQMLSHDTTIDDVTLWWRLDGVDISYSAGIVTVPATHGGKPGTTIVSWNLVQPINAGQYLQLLFASDTGNTVCATYPGGAAPVHPVSPSVIVTATFVSALFP